MKKSAYVRSYALRLFCIALSLLVCGVLPPAALSFAEEFTARYVNDYGNVTVMEVTGNYDARNPDGTNNVAPRQIIAKEFFKTHKDEYDFIIVFSNFNFNMPESEVSGFYTQVRNDVGGIGQEIFDVSQLFGSNGKLQGTIDMGNIASKVVDPLDPGFESTLDILSHEMLHRWGAFVRFKNASGNISNALLGKDGSHWSYLLDTKGSLEYGNQWHDNGDGTFTSGTNRKYFSPLDLYLMGMIDKSQVPPMLLIDNPAINPAKMPDSGVTVSGVPRYVTIDDIIAAEGERVPNAKDAQKQFKAAFILVSTPGTFTGEELYGLENVRNVFLSRYSILTDGRGLVQVASTQKEDVPVNPGVRPQTTVPRTLPPSVDDGVEWLLVHQQADGSWTDFTLTTERDTAEAVMTLQRLSAAQQQLQAGLAWLGINASVTTDYLARRIEVAVQGGGNAGAFVQELLSRRNPDGGWGSGRSFISNPTDTALALKALAHTGYGDQQIIGRAVAYLQISQNQDGGWSGEDTASTIQPTAAVVSAFNAYRKNYAIDGNLSRALAFLAAKQNLDGGFGNSPSTVYDSALAIIALQEAGADRGLISRGADYLLGQQTESGSWQESPYQTALAVRAIWQARVDPDLSIQTEDITFIPAKVTVLPTTAVVNAVIWNLGRTDVSQAKVALYDGAVTPDKKVAEQTVAFPGNSPVTVTFSVPVMDGNGHLFYVIVDPENLVKEGNENNNSAAKTLLPEVTYDFEVLPAYVSVTPSQVDIGQPVKITVKVDNRGTSDAFSVPVRIFIDGPSAPFEVGTFTADIPAGGSVTREVMWKTNKAGDSMQLTVQADPNNAFSETSEINNSSSASLIVNGSTFSNLSVSYKDITITPGAVLQEGDASISILVRNDGFSSAENVKVSFYRGVANKDGVLLGSVVVPAIPAGQGELAVTEWADIAEVGSQVISVLVDPENSIQEFSEDDNFTFTTMSILSLPDLIVTSSSISLSPSAPKEGDSVSVGITVQNQGEQDAVDVAVKVMEGGSTVGSAMIPVIRGKSQGVATIAYPALVQKGARQLTVAVDPDNTIGEQNEANNTATKSFAVQNASLWVSEPFFSPNGDGVKDTTDFSFRLAAPSQARVLVVNRKEETVRTFAGGELDNTTGTLVTWDGRSDIGTVVEDGEYQLKIVDATHWAVLGSLPVVVDNNRSSMTEAIGTKYMILGPISDKGGRVFWSSDESGLIFNKRDSGLNYSNRWDYYSITGSDSTSIIPLEWIDGTDPAYSYTIEQTSLSPDGEKLATIITKRPKVYGNGQPASHVVIIDKDGSNLAIVDSDSILALGKRYFDLQWSLDGKWLQYRQNYNDPVNVSAYSHTDLCFVHAQNTIKFKVGPTQFNESKSLVSSWSPDNRKISYHSTGELWLVDIESRSLSHVESINEAGISKISWMPSGKLAYSIKYPDHVVLRLAADSGVKDLLDVQGQYIQDMSWLIDDKLAVMTTGSNKTELWLLDTKSDVETINLAYFDYSGFEPGTMIVSPDKKLLAYDLSGDEYRSISLFVLDSQGSSVKLMDRSSQNWIYLADMTWSYDSKKIALREETEDAYTWEYISKCISVDIPTNKITSIDTGIDYWHGYLDGWLSDNKSVLYYSSQYGYEIVFDTEEGTFAKLLPNFDTVEVGQISPSGNQAVLSTWYPFTLLNMAFVHNLFTDVGVASTKSALTIKATAIDLNFEGYRLEFADAKFPEAWNLISPPSDVAVVNEVIATWIPPYEGTFFVRLTAWDKAGNTAISKKRVSWGGQKQAIAGMYKDIHVISPMNGDGVNDEVKLYYTVLLPVHLEFKVYNELGDLVDSMPRDYTGYTSDFVAWDGRDFSNNPVPDGKYTIMLFDFVFTVDVDNTPPDVGIYLGGVIIDGTILKDVSGLEYPERAKSSISALIKAHAFDTGLKNWSIEYGEGDNPSEWHAYKQGESNVGKKGADGNILIPAENEILSSIFFTDIIWMAGKKLKISAEDSAGNKSSMVSGYLEDQRVWQAGWSNKSPMYFYKEDLLKIKMPKFETNWHYLDQQVLNPSDSRSVILGIYRDDLVKGIAYEVLRFPVASRHIQVFDMDNGRWQDSPIPLAIVNGEVEADFSNVDTRFIDAVRFKSMDVSGNIFLSNTFLVLGNEQINGGGQIISPFGGYDTDSGSGAIIPTAAAITFNVTYPDNIICGQGSGEVVLPTGNLLLTEVSKVTYLINRGGTQSIFGESRLENDGWSPLTVDTSVLAEGSYPLKALVTFKDDTEKSLDLAKDVLVDRTLPTAQITVPDSASLCPLRLSGPGGEWLGIEVKGIVADNTKIKKYTLSYGTGEKPVYWLVATAGNGREQKEITGNVPVNGILGVWNVTNLPGSVFTLRLMVTDIVGNVSCFTRTVNIDKEITIGSLSVGNKLFSPFNGVVHNTVSVGFEVGEQAVVGLTINNLVEDAGHSLQLGTTSYKNIISNLNYAGGVTNAIWDGRNDAGTVVPDGFYGASLVATDICGNSAKKWTPVEVDSTPPTVAISYPNPAEPLPPGNILEIKGVVLDKHFKSYTLECGQGDSPTAWEPVTSGLYPVNGAVLGGWNTYGHEGRWTLRLTATDEAGNTGSTTATFDLGIRKQLIRNLEAVPKLISPNDDGKVDTTQVNFELTDACEVKIDILDTNGAIVNNHTASSSAGTSRFLWNGKNYAGVAVADGTYQVRLTAVLSADLSINQTESVYVTVDKTKPLIEIGQPADKAYINATTVAVVGTVTDQNLKEYELTAATSGGTQTLDAGNQPRTAYSFGSLRDLAEGEYTLAISALDQVENSVEAKRTFTIDRTSPKATLDQPKNGDFFGAARNVIDITGLLIEKNLEHYSVRYGAGDTPTEWKDVVGGDTVPTSSKLSSWNVGKDAAMADGVYTVSFYARDKAGLEGEARAKIVVDNTPPEVLLSSPINGAYITGALDIKGTAFDPNFEKGVLEFSAGACSGAFNGTAIRTLASSVKDGVLAAWQALAPDGTYCLKLSAADKLGNKAETVVDVKVDNHPPAAPVVTGRIEAKTGVRLDWPKNSEPDLAGYNLYREGQKLNSVMLTDTFFNDVDLEEGNYSYVVKAFDMAGNESAPSNTLKLRVDNTLPIVQITLPSDGGRVNDLVDIKGTASSPDDFKEYRVFVGQGAMPTTWTLIRKSPLPVSSGVLCQWDTFGLAEGTYVIKVEGEDLSGNMATHIILVSIDNTPPQAPQLLTAVPGGSDIALAWKANVEPDLAGYLLYRNDQLANSSGLLVRNLKPFLVTGLSYADTSLPDGTYVYTLAAMDQSSNVSVLSNALTVAIDMRPPHATVVEPVNAQRFGGNITVRAESDDSDIASIQFRYKRVEDAGWSNLGDAVTVAPYAVALYPNNLGLTYSEYQLQAVATDLGGKIDPAPSVTTVTYADLTPPASPSSLKVTTDGTSVNLSWDANSESDLDGYNIYRTSGTSRTKINTTSIKQAVFQDVNLADGTYRYEITAVDIYANESRPSAGSAAKIYAPSITPPFTPIPVAITRIVGAGAEPNAAVEVFTTVGTVQTVAGTFLADAQGNFAAESINLSPGENRITARAKDSVGNTSRMSNDVTVVYSVPPSAPTGLLTTVQDKTVNLSWNLNPETDIAGYNVYRDGAKLNALNAKFAVATASSSSADHAPAFATDWNQSTSWMSGNSQGSFSPVWLELDVPSSSILVDRVTIQWLTSYVGKEFEIQAWSGSSWVTLRKVLGNTNYLSEINITPSYWTNKLRIMVTDTNCTLDTKQVGITQTWISSYRLEPVAMYQQQVVDGTYKYKISAVNHLGFESNASDEVNAEVGDVIPPAQPQGLVSSASGSAITLSWVENSETDLAGYRVYRKTTDGWVKLTASLVSIPLFMDQPLLNASYSYRVTAVDLAGNESVPSGEAGATVAIQIPVPQNLRVVPASEGKVLDLQWDPPAETVASYAVYRSLVAGGPYLKLSKVPLEGHSYHDTGLVIGTTYYYVVTAMDPAGNESAFSNEAFGLLPDSTLPSRPILSYPTVPGVPITLFAPITDIAGMAEPGIRVELFRNTLALGNTVAAVEDTITLIDIPPGASYPVITPDNQYLAYYLNSDLWVKDLATEETIRIITPSGGEVTKWYPPAISPEGKILFEYRYSGRQYRLAIYDVNTGTTTSFTNDPDALEWNGVWFNDGKRVAFVSERNGANSIYVKDMEAGITTLLAEADYPDYLALSPDNKKIAYYEYPVEGDRLVVKDVETGLTIWTTSDNDGYSVSWSPDSTRIAYIDSIGDLITYNFDTNLLQGITASGTGRWLPTWSPDGKQIALNEYWEDGTNLLWIFDMNGNGRLVRDNIDLFYLSWTSSGTLLCATRSESYSVTPAGTFKMEGVALNAGDNSITAKVVDESGTASASSDAISVILDTTFMPDTGLSDGDINILPAVPKPGEDVVVTAVVRNQGAVKVDNLSVAMYLWDAAGQLNLLKTEIVPHLPSLGSMEIGTTISGITTLGTYSVIVVLDPENSINEFSESNNIATKDFFVTDREEVTFSTVLDAAQYGAHKDVSIDLTIRNSGWSSNGTLSITVEDMSGNTVALVDRTSVTIPYGVRDYSHTWNAGSTFAGSYKVHVVFTATDGTVTESSTSFDILPEILVDASVVTDKQGYDANENLGVSSSINNIGSNYIIPQLKIRVMIKDPNDTVLFTEEKNVQNLLPGTGSSVKTAWNTGLTPAGSYQALVETYLSDQLVNNKAATFNINPDAGVHGTVTAGTPTVPAGNAVKADYTIRNSGNMAMSGLVRISVTDRETQSFVASDEVLVNLAVNAEQAGHLTFSTQGWALKSYQLNLQYIYQGNTKNIASATFTVKDSVPPAVAIISPVSVKLYNAKVPIAVLASDDVSGINTVEYQIDSAGWKAIPLADAAKGRYAAVWEADSKSTPRPIYFRVTDRAGNTTSESQTINFRPEAAPTEPSLLSPANGADLETFTPGLLVNNASDPNEDELTYEFELYSDRGLTHTVASSGAIPAGSSATLWQVPATLNENAGYFWRVRAFDGQLYGPWMTTAAFRVNTTNDPPGAPTPSAPADGGEVAMLAPVLSINNASDPDSQSLTYNFAVSLDAGFTQLIASAQGVFSGEGITSWQVPVTLIENQQYFWRAQADDWLTEGPWMNGARFIVNTTNESPTVPTVVAPPDRSEVVTLVQDIVVTNSTDPDSSTLTYSFELDTTPSFDSPDRIIASNVQSGEMTTVWQVANLQDNTRYYVRVKASDGLTESPWSSVSSFFANTINDPPTTPVLANPSNGAGVNVFNPILSVQNATDSDSDPITYEFELYGDAAMTVLVASATGISETLQETSWAVPVALEEDKIYNWRARAFDGELNSKWTTSASFKVNTADDPPSAPALSSPVDGSSVATLNPTVAVFNATDPDSRDLTYDFEIYGANTLVYSFYNVPEDSSGVTSVTLETPLADNSTFQWRCRSYDGNAFGPWMNMASFSTHVQQAFVNATIRIEPETLCKKSNGTWVMAKIMLPQGYNVSDIDIASIRFEGLIHAEKRPVSICRGNDQRSELKVKFRRSDVLAILPPGESVLVHVTGKVGNVIFEGVDTVRVNY